MNTKLRDIYQGLKTGLEEAVEYQERFNGQVRLALETRFCLWPGQSEDGRKWKAKLGRDVFPFDGASDARVPLVDLYIQQDLDILLVALWAKRVGASPVEAGDAKKSSKIQNFVRWLLYQQTEELDAEAELLANYLLERGRAVMRVQWERIEELAYETLTMEQVLQLAQQAGMQDPEGIMARLPELILDPEQDESLGAWAADLLDVEDATARQMIRDLRKSGEARWPKARVVKNRPVLSALCPGVDVFWPADTTELDQARQIFVVEHLSEQALRSRAAALEWDEIWLDEVVFNARGKMTANLQPNADVVRPAGGQGTQGVDSDTKDLYQIVTAYSRRSDEAGVTGVWVTVFCPGYCGENTGGDFLVAADELLDYWHGHYPFVLFRRERWSRRPDDSRAYGEVAATWQNQIKTEWDGRVDRASMATMPPLEHPKGRAPMKWGPGVKLSYITRGETHYADIPRYDIGSKEVEASVRQMANEYFGRATKGTDPMYSTARLRRLTMKWLLGWSTVVNQMFSLYAQFGPPETIYRVIGGTQEPQRITRDEIQGKWDVSIGFNTLTLDMEQLKQVLGILMELVNKVDINGVVDRNAFLRLAFDIFDPNIGELVLKDAEDARQAEADDEDSVFVKLMAGLEVPVKPGQAHGLRLERLRNNVQTSRMAQQLIQSDEGVKGVFEKRVKQLEFQLQQRQNAIIGKLGA